MRPTPSDKKPLVHPSVLSRNTSFYTETVLNSPCAMKAKEIEIAEEDIIGYTRPREDDGDSDSESDVDDKRSISPLIMSPLLARLPSVKTAGSTRVAELVRSGNASRDEPAAFWVGDNDHHGSAVSTPPKIDTRMSVLERRSALFSPHEFPHLFQAVVGVNGYNDQQVLVENEAVAGLLRRFNVSGRHEAQNVVSLARVYDLDVWSVSNSHIDIYWPQGAASSLPPDLEEVPHTTRSVPLTMTSHKTSEKPDWNLRHLNKSSFHETYHHLDEVEEFMRQLEAQFPNTTKVHRVALTAEGRDVYALEISKPESSAENNDDKKKKKKKKKKEGKHPLGPKLNFVIVGAQHAREWIATSTSLYLAHALSLNSTDLHSLLDVFNFHIIPSPNPDGYVYTWEEDRYWYKNRQIVDSHVKCRGLDTNRNWGYKWHPEPVHGPFKPTHPVDPCSHWYPGGRPFESAEVNGIANYVNTLTDLIGFLDLRSYGQMISTPYSYSCNRYPKDIEDQTEAAYGAVQAIKASHGVHFEAGRVCETLYEAPGNILDWMYSKEGIKYSYAVHLRDTGTWGFSLPEKYIRPVGEETSGMVRYLGKFIAAKLNRKL
ncbi:hypothetical protein H1R20_g13950, partial [Candolleomyces eurysporus]